MTQDTKPVNIGEIEAKARTEIAAIDKEFEEASQDHMMPGWERRLKALRDTDETFILLTALVRELHDALRPFACDCEVCGDGEKATCNRSRAANACKLVEG